MSLFIGKMIYTGFNLLALSYKQLFLHALFYGTDFLNSYYITIQVDNLVLIRIL
jgi:hypothetical protein